jgi:hypothetical protein
MPKVRPDLAARMARELGDEPEEQAPRPVEPARAAAAEEGRGPGYVAPSRRNMKRIQGYFSARVKRQLKILAAEQGKTEEQLVGEALNLLFQAHRLPAITFEGKEGR